MRDESWELLRGILDCPVATGDEQRLQRMLRSWAKRFADRVQADVHGNLFVTLNPGAPRTLMLAGHCDRIGFMVADIDKDGYIRVDPLGGIDEATLLGSRVLIRGPRGEVPGVFGKTATHYQEESEREKVPKLDTMWVDIGVRDKEEAEKYVAVGNYAVYEPRLTKLVNRRIASPGLDNALGLCAIMEATRRCAGRKLGVTVECVSTVQEEVGSRGAESAVQIIHPDLAIAVDTTLAIDDPSTPKKKTAPKIKLDAGPTISLGPNTNVVFGGMLVNCANRLGIKHQREANAELESNDAKPLQVAADGTAAASIGIPIRNMHTPNEVASLQDLEWTIELLVEFIQSVRPDDSFSPIDHDGTAEGPVENDTRKGGRGTENGRARGQGGRERAGSGRR